MYITKREREISMYIYIHIYMYNCLYIPGFSTSVKGFFAGPPFWASILVWGCVVQNGNVCLVVSENQHVPCVSLTMSTT